MFGGRYFDNVWDPYRVAYAYPRPRYYRPRDDQYEVPEDRANEQPSDKRTVKKVKTIPVTDGAAPALKQPVAKSEGAAATEIQAFYRGYVVRKTQPLQHLKVIRKVKVELESLKLKSLEAEQLAKLRSDPKERLRWTEGVMALLLRLDSLQGVHPDVRLVRKAVTKELLGFQETIDSMSSVPADSNDVICQESSGSLAAPAPEVVEEMEIEDNIPRGAVQDSASGEASENAADDVEIKSNEDISSDKQVPDASLTSNDYVMEAVAPHCDENGLLEAESIVEVGEPSASETRPEGSMGAENEEQPLMMTPAHLMEEDENEPASAQSVLPGIGIRDAEADMSERGVNRDGPTLSMSLEPQCEQDDKQFEVNALTDRASMQQELGDNENEDVKVDTFQSDVNGEYSTVLEEGKTSGLDDRTVSARISEQSMALEPQCEQDDKHDNANALTDSSLAQQKLEENRNEDAEVNTSQSGVNGDNPTLPRGKETIVIDGSIVPARTCAQSMALEPQCKQDDKINSSAVLSDRSLLLQVLEENRKLKDVLGKVLEWGKQQNDAIHNLTHRIAQLEEHQSPSNLLHGEDRKRVRPADNTERSRRRQEKGRRNRRHRSYVDSEDWPSLESDDYF